MNLYLNFLLVLFFYMFFYIYQNIVLVLYDSKYPIVFRYKAFLKNATMAAKESNSDNMDVDVEDDEYIPEGGITVGERIGQHFFFSSVTLLF